MLLENNEKFRADHNSALLYREIDLLTPPEFDMSNYCILHNQIIQPAVKTIPKWRSLIPKRILKLLCANVVLAGGSLVTLLNNRDDVNDWDLFIIGGKNNDILKKIIAKLGGTATISRGLVNIAVDELRIQIILRAVPSLSALIYGFDLPNCAIAFDGNELYMSQLALYSFHFNMLFVSVLYCSPSFIYRIFKYYNKFNYSICILDLDRSMMKKNIAIGRLLFTMDDDHFIIQTELLNKNQDCNLSWLDTKIMQVLEPLQFANPFIVTYDNANYYARIMCDKVILPIIGRHGMIVVEYHNNILESTMGEIIGVSSIESFDEVYKGIFEAVYRIQHNYRVKRKLRLLFPPDLLMMIKESKITLRQASKIIYDDAICRLDKVIEYWIISNPSSQFDMRFLPLSLKIDQFYKIF
jgi:hypothetical protein